MIGESEADMDRKQIDSVVCDWGCLANIAHRARAAGQRLVATSGAFDLFHDAHALYLEETARYGDVLFVGVDSDDLVTRYKGALRPICGQDVRLKVVAAQSSVDCAVIMHDWPAFIRLVSPQVVVVSPTTKVKDAFDRRLTIESAGAEMVSVSSRSATHTSDLIKVILKRYGPK